MSTLGTLYTTWLKLDRKLSAEEVSRVLEAAIRADDTAMVSLILNDQRSFGPAHLGRLQATNRPHLWSVMLLARQRDASVWKWFLDQPTDLVTRTLELADKRLWVEESYLVELFDRGDTDLRLAVLMRSARHMVSARAWGRWLMDAQPLRFNKVVFKSLASSVEDFIWPLVEPTGDLELLGWTFAASPSSSWHRQRHADALTDALEAFLDAPTRAVPDLAEFVERLINHHDGLGLPLPGSRIRSLGVRALEHVGVFEYDRLVERLGSDTDVTQADLLGRLADPVVPDDVLSSALGLPVADPLWQAVAGHRGLLVEQAYLLLGQLPASAAASPVLAQRSQDWLLALARRVWSGGWTVNSEHQCRLLGLLEDPLGFISGVLPTEPKWITKVPQLGFELADVIGCMPLGFVVGTDDANVSRAFFTRVRRCLTTPEAWELFEALVDEHVGSVDELVLAITALED